MSQASVLDLVAMLGSRQPVLNEIIEFYEDAMTDVARQAMFNVFEIIPATAGLATYTIPARMSEILGVFYDDVMLSLATIRELESVGMQWRDSVGRPVAYLTEDLSRHTIQLYPAPVTTGGPVIPVHGAPFGLDYPVDTLAILGSEVRADLPAWMDLPLALLVLAKEFARDSPHMDTAFAGSCRTLGAVCLSMVA